VPARDSRQPIVSIGLSEIGRADYASATAGTTQAPCRGCPGDGVEM